MHRNLSSSRVVELKLLCQSGIFMCAGCVEWWSSSIYLNLVGRCTLLGLSADSMQSFVLRMWASFAFARWDMRKDKESFDSKQKRHSTVCMTLVLTVFPVDWHILEKINLLWSGQLTPSSWCTLGYSYSSGGGALWNC